MSNTDFETKVLNALWTLQEDVSWLKTDVAWLKTDVVSLKGHIVRLDNKIDKQTHDLKNEMAHQTAYLNQAFINISRIDQERFMEKHSMV